MSCGKMRCFENSTSPNIQETNAASFTGKANGIHFYHVTDDSLIIRADRREGNESILYCKPHFPNM
jgi:hypothetical protein